MFIAVLGILIILLLLILIFRDSYLIRDLKTDMVRKMKAPSRTPIVLRQSQPTTPYEAEFSDVKNFSQPYDGKFTQYDFSLPLLPHRSSTYYSSNAFLVNKKIKKPIPTHQPLADESIVEHHRFYHENSNKKQKLSSRKQKSSKLPSTQDVYKSATQFHENKSSISFRQIYSSAENPYVLPSIVKKKEKEEEKISSNSSSNISATSSSNSFTIPPPPQSTPNSSGGSQSTTTTTTPKFSFQFTPPKT